MIIFMVFVMYKSKNFEMFNYENYETLPSFTDNTQQKLEKPKLVRSRPETLLKLYV